MAGQSLETLWEEAAQSLLRCLRTEHLESVELWSGDGLGNDRLITCCTCGRDCIVSVMAFKHGVL